MTLVFAGPDLTRFVGSHSSATQGCSPVAVIFWWGRSRLQQLAHLVKARGVCFAFAPRPTKNLPPEVSEQIDPHTHLQSALSARHPLFAHALIDPSAEYAVELQENSRVRPLSLASSSSRRDQRVERRMPGRNFVVVSAVTATWSDRLPRSCVSQCASASSFR